MLEESQEHALGLHSVEVVQVRKIEESDLDALVCLLVVIQLVDKLIIVVEQICSLRVHVGVARPLV